VATESKEEKEKQDLVIFSILLLISRLVPSFQLVSEELEGDAEASIRELVELIGQYHSNKTYFVRKIAA